MDYYDILYFASLSRGKKKKEYIEEHKDDPYFRDALFYTLNPFVTYGVSRATLMKHMKPFKDPIISSKKIGNVFDACKLLAKNYPTRTYCLEKVGGYLYSLYDKAELEFCIRYLSKELKLGITGKVVNTIIPEFIPVWDVQKGVIYKKDLVPDDTEFWLTQKLNGVRATYFKGKLISRMGIPYSGVSHITKALKFADENGVVLDGEITLKSKPEGMTDNEAFRIASGIINSNNPNKEELKYTIFDIIPESDFTSSNPTIKYRSRRKFMDENAQRFLSDSVSVLPVLYHGKDKSVIPDLLKKMVSEDKEGLMMNLNAPYLKEKHKGLLKIKQFYTMDLRIIGFEEGKGFLQGTLGSIVMKFEGHTVKVGSGLTEEQRAWIWKKRKELLRKKALCEVKYKEISMDKNTGRRSLQFPSFVRIRTDKTTESDS